MLTSVHTQIKFMVYRFVVYTKECVKTNVDGSKINIDIAYVRGSQIRFIILPNTLSKAPFFNRIKMWRKFKGHAVFGLGGLIGPRGQTAAIMQKSQQNRRPMPGGPMGGGPSGISSGAPPGQYGQGGYRPPQGGPGMMPPRGIPPPYNSNQPPPYQQQQGPSHSYQPPQGPPQAGGYHQR